MVLAVGIDFEARSCSVSRVDRTHRVDLPVRMLEVVNMGQDYRIAAPVAHAESHRSQVDL